MKICLLFLLFVLALASAKAQVVDNDEKQLLDLAVNHRGLFVYTRPMHKIRIDWDDTLYMFRTRVASHLTRKEISTKSLVELVKNSFALDTTVWTTQELDSVVLVIKRDDDVNLPEHLKRLNSKNEKLIKFYKKGIRRYNAADPPDRDIAVFSRPVFDDSKTYAIIGFSNGYFLSGGGYISLYKWEKRWRELGVISTWAD